MNPSPLISVLLVLSFALASASGQSAPKLEKAFASLTLGPGETAKLVKLYPSFQSPLHFLEVSKRDGWTVQLERLDRNTEDPTVELSFSIQMESVMGAAFDPKVSAKDWEEFLKEVKDNPTPPVAFDGIAVELHARIGNEKDVTAAINIERVPVGLPNEQIAPGIDALLARLIKMTGILPRFSLGMPAVGIKQIDPHKN